MVKGIKITRHGKKGGLGIKDLRLMNMSLLCKWWWKIENGEGLWQEIFKKKYKIEGGISHLKSNQNNSPVWSDLLKVKYPYLKGRIIKIGNGLDTDFWNDPWCGVVPLRDKFQELFDIC